jgi:thiosulfate dehydrogenase
MELVKPSRLLFLVITSLVVIVTVLATTGKSHVAGSDKTNPSKTNQEFDWHPPDTSQISFTPEGNLIRYGRDLIANTSVYLGPKGSVAAISNGMNCQNCHLDAGTKSFGNNYGAVFSTYPRFRERSGTVENIYKRVNDCLERSLNASRGLDTMSREMQAIKAYITWLGQNVPKGVKPVSSGIAELPYPDRSADPVKGERVYMQNCQRCHGANGEGILNAEKTAYIYPPLWGPHSYTTAAGLYRITRFAGYVKLNMPFDAPHNARSITDDEAWDVAAFVNSRPRPGRKYPNDWLNIAGKPIDHPFGPYADNFSEAQHKYGPFEPIKLARSKK